MKNDICAFDKINQTINKFNAINQNLEKTLGLKFFYTALFKDGSYYTLNSNIECIKKIVLNINQGMIICDQNISSTKDSFSYLLWPEASFNKTTEIYAHYGYQNSISLIRDNGDYFDVFCFSPIDNNKNWKEFFLINKQFLKEYIQYFENYKKELLIDESNIRKGLLSFSEGLNCIYPESFYIEEERKIKALQMALFKGKNRDYLTKFNAQLAPREMEIFHLIASGYSAKAIALELGLATKTIQYYIENLKKKLSLNTKQKLVEYYALLNSQHS